MPSTTPFIMRYNDVVEFWLDLNGLSLETDVSCLPLEQAKSLSRFVTEYPSYSSCLIVSRTALCSVDKVIR